MRPADWIKLDVVARLEMNEKIDASKVTVEVYNGTVRLAGFVSDAAARIAAQQDAWAVTAVTGVENDIVIGSTEDPAFPTDEEVLHRVNLALRLSPALDAASIYASVQGRLVRLEGQVDAAWKQDIAEHLVASIRFVLAVDNRLSIVPPRGASSPTRRNDGCEERKKGTS